MDAAFPLSSLLSRTRLCAPLHYVGKILLVMLMPVPPAPAPPPPPPTLSVQKQMLSPPFPPLPPMGDAVMPLAPPPPPPEAGEVPHCRRYRSERRLPPLQR